MDVLLDRFRKPRLRLGSRVIDVLDEEYTANIEAQAEALRDKGKFGQVRSHDEEMALVEVERQRKNGKKAGRGDGGGKHRKRPRSNFYGCWGDEDALMEVEPQLETQVRTAGVTPNEVAIDGEEYEREHKRMVEVAEAKRQALFDLQDAIDSMEPEHVARELQRNLKTNADGRIHLIPPAKAGLDEGATEVR